MTQKQDTNELERLLEPHRRNVEGDLRRWLVEADTPETLAEAMRYCVGGRGKRLRPALVFLAGEALGHCPPGQMARRCAVAVEMVHCYSLVHDDLPAMDNDLMRRGRPTAHVRFGQAMAILAGDALLTRAMGILAEGDGAAAPRLVAELSSAAGAAGMIAGQVADMGLCPVAEGQQGIEYIHLRKTGALIRASVRMGALCAGASEDQLKMISGYGRLLGLGFQLVDDLLDATGDEAVMGKAAGKDAADEKRTHASLLGLERSAELARGLTAQACKLLEPLGENARALKSLATLLGERTY